MFDYSGSNEQLPNDADIISNASPYWKKMVNTVLTIDEKYDLIKEHGIQKDAQLEGYRRGYLTYIPDADSGTLIDEETGSPVQFRTNNINNYDAVDSYGAVYGDESHRASWNKQRSQPNLVAELTGKRVEDLTPEDFANVKNYQTQEWYGSLTNPNHQFSKYDKNKLYNALELPEGTKIPIMYKVTSSGEKYNRNLVDLISGTTGRPVVFDAMQNPYLNATNMPFVKGDKSEQYFDVYRALGTTENQKKLRELHSKEGADFVASVNHARDHSGIDFTERANKYIEKYEQGTNWFERLIDKFTYAGKNAGQSFEDMAERVARYTTSDNPEAEYLKKLAKDSKANFYDDFIDSSTARKLMYRKAQLENQNTVKKAMEDYDNGKTLEAAKGLLKSVGQNIMMLPEMLGDSAAQMITSGTATAIGTKAGAAVGTAIAPGVGSALGGILGAIGGYLAGSLTIAADETLMSRDEYAKNNNGKRMSSSDILEEFGLQFAAAMPEVYLQKLGFKKAFQGTTVGKYLFKGDYKPLSLGSKAAHVGGSAVGEMGQEYAQNLVSSYYQQDQTKKKNWLELAKDPENIGAAISGLVMGGGLATTGATFSIRSDAKVRAAMRNAEKGATENTILASKEHNLEDKADTELSTKTIKEVESIKVSSEMSGDDKIKTYQNLQQKSLQSSLSVKAMDAIQAKQHEIAESLVHDLDKIDDTELRRKNQDALFKSLGITKEEYFSDAVYHSNYNAVRLFREGKIATEETIEKAKKELQEEARYLGIPDMEVTKVLEQVNQEASSGPLGYRTYSNKLNHILETVSTLEGKDKMRAQREYGMLVNRLVSLIGNQQAKLNDLVNAIEQIARGEARDVYVRYRSGYGGFEVRGSNVASERSQNERKGVYAVLDSVEHELNAMQHILSDVTKRASEVKDSNGNKVFLDTSSVIDVYNKLESQRPSNEAKFYVPTADTDSLVKRFNNAVTTISDDVKKVFKERRKGKKFNVSSIAGKLERVADPKTKDDVVLAFTQDIRNFIDENSTEEIKAEVSRRFDRNPGKRQRLLDTLNAIDKHNTETQTKVVERNKAKETVYEEVKEALKNHTQENIKNTPIDDIPKLADTLNTLITTRTKFKEVADSSESDQGLIEQLNDLITAGQERLRSIKAEELAESDKKKKESAKKEQPKSNRKTITRTIKGVKATYTEVPRDFKLLKGTPARTNANGVLIANDITVKDVAVVKSMVNLLKEYGVDFNEATKNLTDEQARDFVLLHELGHMQQVKDAGSYDQFIKNYNETLFTHETEATLFALEKFGFVTADRVKEIIKAIRDRELALAEKDRDALNKFYDDTFGKPVSDNEARPVDESVSKPITKADAAIVEELANKTETAKEIEDSIVNDIEFEHPVESEVVHAKESGYGTQTHMLPDGKTLYVYGGRGSTSGIGNPYNMNHNEAKRQEVIRKCWSDPTWMEKVKTFITNEIKNHPEVTKVILGCWCKAKKAPKACHLDKVAELIKAISNKVTKKPTEQPKSKLAYKPLGTKDNPINIYSDGSDIKGTGNIGYGAVFEYNGKEYALSGTNEDDAVKDLQTRFPDAKFSNPTMEMLALSSALETIANLGVGEHIVINQDYKGAVNYAGLWEHSEGSAQRASDKPWKAKEKYIKYLVDKAVRAIETIKANGGSVSIQWVKGHQSTATETGRMNDRADTYAKSRELLNTFANAYTQETSETQDTQISESTQSTVNDSQTETENVTPNPSQEVSSQNQAPQSLSNEKTEVSEESTPEPITSFKGEYEFLSNDSEATTEDADESKKLVYRNAEAALQASKFDDYNTRRQFINLTPAQARTKAEKLELDEKSLEEWNKNKTTILKNILWSKFTSNKKLTELLLATGDAKLINDAADDVDNELGKLLMELREVLRIERDTTTSRSLLNSSKNKSANFSASLNRTFRLSNEFKVGKADSLIATDPSVYDNEFTKSSYGGSKSPKEIFEGMRLPTDKLDSPYDYMRHVIDSAPHLRLIYSMSMKKDENGKAKLNDKGNIDLNIDFNEITLKAIDFAVKEVMVSKRYGDLFKPFKLPDHRLASIFGLNESNLTYRQRRTIRNFIKNNGVPRAIMADMIGTQVMKNLGIKVKDDEAHARYYSRTAFGLGMFALRYAEKLGVLKRTEYNKTEAQKNDKEYPIESDHIFCVQIEKAHETVIDAIADVFKDKKDDQGNVTQKGLISQLKPDKDSHVDRDIRWKKPARVPKKMYVRNTDNLLSVPPKAKEVIEELFNQEYAINMELMDFVKENREAIEKYLGYQTDEQIAELYHSRQVGAEASNKTIKEQLQELVDAVDEYNKLIADGTLKEGDGGIFFEWFMSRNGRFFIDSDTLNPQTNKLQRFICMPKAVYRTFNYTQEDIEQEAFAVAQAFDNVKHSNEDILKIGQAMNVLSVEQLEEIRSDIFALSGSAFEKKWNNLAGEGLGLKGVENLAQCLGVIQHFITKKNAGFGLFKTWLAVENDSTTSGYAIRFANMPLASMHKQMAKTGILMGDELLKYGDDKDIHELKARDDFDDLYESTAKDIKDDLDSLDPNTENGTESVEKTFREFFTTPNELAVKFLKDTWVKLYKAMPRATKEKVSSALRTLMKSPTMVFGYSGGIKGISENMSYEVMDEFIQTYLNMKKAGGKNKYLANSPNADVDKINSIDATFVSLEEAYIARDGDTLEQALRNRDLDTIKLKVGNSRMDIERVFYMLIRPTYGKAVDEALDKNFKPYKMVNDLMNQSFITMFQWFNKLFKDATKGLKNPTIRQVNEIVESLRDMFPSMPTAYGPSFDDGAMLFLKTSKPKGANTDIAVTDPTGEIGTDENGRPQLKSETGFANERSEFTTTAKAGAVGSIHWTDGAIMASVLHSFINIGITPIHDALVLSALAHRDATKYMNESILKNCMDFDIFGTLTGRMLEVTKNYIKRTSENKDPNLDNITDLDTLIAVSNTNPDIARVLDEPIRGFDGNVKTITVDKEKYEVSLKQFLEDLGSMNATLGTERENAYNQKIVVVNVDGSNVAYTHYPEDMPVGTGEIQRGIEAVEPKWQSVEDAKKDAEKLEDTDSYNSGYMGYQTNGMILDTLERTITDVNARAEFAQQLHDNAIVDGNRTCSNRHIERLKKTLVLVNPIKLKNLVVELAKDGKLLKGPYNAGQLEIKNGKFTVHLVEDDKSTQVDSVTRQSVYSGMSMAETYSHEVVHAGLHFAFTEHLNNRIKFTSEIRQLQELQLAASQVLTADDFMPTDYDPKLEAFHRKHAQNTWNYIFNNPNDEKTLEGLKEFCAYGLTHERIVDKLSTIKTPEKSIKFRNLADRLLYVVKGIFDIVFKGAPIGNVFPLANALIKGTATIKGGTIYDDLAHLTYKMSNADAKAARSLMSQAMKPLEYLFKLTNDLRLWGNKHLGTGIKWATTIGDRWNKTSVLKRQLGTSRWNDAKTVAKSLATLLISANSRKVVKQVMTDIFKASQQGAIMSILNDVTTPDMQSMRLQFLSMVNRTIDTDAKSAEAISYREISEKFGKKKLSELEESALTYIGLFTDLQCLLDDNTTVDDVLKLVTDDKARQAQIEAYENTLKSNKNYNWLVTQARGLGLYMITGKGNTNQNLNAYNIARGILHEGAVRCTPREEILIDKLATLYALDMTNADYRTVFSSLNKEGLDYFLSSHKSFVKSSMDGVSLDTGEVIQTVRSAHVIKGYTKALFDTSYDIQIGFESDRKVFEEMGYELVKVLPENQITSARGTTVYRRNFANPARRDGAAVKIVGAHSMGTSLKESAYSIAAHIDPLGQHLKARDMWDVFVQEADTISKDMQKLADRRPLTIEELKKYSTGYTPIISPNTGEVLDYRVTMSTQDKIDILGMDTRGITILSKMFASQEMKAKAPAVNQAVTDFLVANMENNMTAEHKDIKTGVNYIRITPFSQNKYLRDSWNVIPKEIKDKANELDKNNGTGLWVREDWLHDLFGVENYSLTQSMPKDKWTRTKRMVSIAEYVMKALTYVAKRNIVLFIPQVLIGNIASNAAYNVMNGTNPIKTLSYTLANFRAIRDYMDTKKKLERIKFREKIGKATAQESSSKNMLKAMLTRNRVHPLMQKGMYQAVVEDMNPDELENVGKVIKLIKNWKVAEKVPAPLKWLVKNLYMTEGTFLYNFMFTLTQYSDFAARATEYQSKLDDIEKTTPKFLKNGQENPDWRDKEEVLSSDILRAFINYDKPQSKSEQYLNDMGLLMFTKFAKRIQSVITDQITKNPMGVLMFLAVQCTFVDVENIMEQHWAVKHWSALPHNPVTNFISAVIPPYLHSYYGIR